MSEGDERFHRKNGLKRKKIRDPGEKALARGVALLGVKVTGIEPPRLTFVTVYRLPIRLLAQSALISQKRRRHWTTKEFVFFWREPDCMYINDL